MISCKIAKVLLKAERRSIKLGLDEHLDVEFLTILLMSVVDKFICGNYIKSNSLDDDAFINFVENDKYDRFDAYVDRGLIRESISRPIRNKVSFLSSSDWEQVVMECLFILNKTIKIDENKIILKDKNLQDFFSFKNLWG